MVHYCINTIICSALLFLLYKALLENEKMHVFKRFYLLFSIALSLVAPLITLTFSAPITIGEYHYIPVQAAKEVLVEQHSPAPGNFNFLLTALIILYLVGCSVALFRFAGKLVHFPAMFKKEETLSIEGAGLVLIDHEIPPHSFLNKIFLSASAYKNNKIESEIIAHELAHVKQQHSLDILFTRLIQCFYWFNPFFIFYLRAIQLNHEFLADEAAVLSSNNPLTYQQLLLNKASGKSQFSLASSFNYSIIKKRLVMITQQTSPRVLLFKKITLISLLMITAFLFAKKETIAQKAEPPKTKTEMPSTKEGASQDLLNEYEGILSKHKSVTKKGNPEHSPFSDEEEARLLVIYQQMTKEQQEKQQVRFIANRAVTPTGGPTSEQLNSWLDAKKYYVKIDGWKIKNEQLANHKPNEFVQVYVYKPNKGSTDYGKYYAQINLMTKESYAKQVAWAKSTPYVMVFMTPKSNLKFK